MTINEIVYHSIKKLSEIGDKIDDEEVKEMLNDTSLELAEIPKLLKRKNKMVRRFQSKLSEYEKNDNSRE